MLRIAAAAVVLCVAESALTHLSDPLILESGLIDQPPAKSCGANVGVSPKNIGKPRPFATFAASLRFRIRASKLIFDLELQIGLGSWCLL